jgi:hypothetical protein
MNSHSQRIARTALLLLFAALSAVVWGQASANDLLSFDQARLGHQRTAMLALGGWAVGNIAVGLTLRGRSAGQDRYFHEMNALWNGVNLGIAALGYWSASQGGASPTLYDAMREHYGFQKILLFNAGLDLGYMAGGLYLMERAKNTDQRPERLRGYGRAILLQGAFLFAFDLANYFISAGRDTDVKLLLGATEHGIGMVVHW